MTLARLCPGNSTNSPTRLHFEQARTRVLSVGVVIGDVLDRADRDDISTTEAANKLAKARLQSDPVTTRQSPDRPGWR